VSVADSQVLLAATLSPKPVKPPRTCAIKFRLPRHPPAARTFTRRRLCFAAARSSTREVLRSRVASSVWLRELPDLVSDVQRLVTSRLPLHARGASRLCFWLVPQLGSVSTSASFSDTSCSALDLCDTPLATSHPRIYSLSPGLLQRRFHALQRWPTHTSRSSSDFTDSHPRPATTSVRHSYDAPNTPSRRRLSLNEHILLEGP
jgi:hypothetical protein